MKKVTKQTINPELKSLLIKFNTNLDVSIDKFLEKCIYDYGLKVQMDKFKRALIKFFGTSLISVPEVNQIATSLSIDSKGVISLVDVIVFFYDIQDKKLIHPLFIFCLIANLINEKYQCTTIEFLALNSLSIEQEININQFLYKIAQPLNLTDIESLIVFKALNINNNSKIKLFDFVNLIDSYRDDNWESAPRVTMDELSLTKKEFNYIGRYCSLCLEYKINDIELFKECAGVNELDSNTMIQMDKFKGVMKAKFINVSDDDIDSIVEAFDSKNEGSVNFKQYSNAINFCKYEVYSTTTQLNFNKTGIKKTHCIPVKENKLAINQLYQEILNSLSSKHKNPLNGNSFQKPMNNTDRDRIEKQTENDFHEENNKTQIVKDIMASETDEWRLIELIEDIKTPHYTYLTSYELFDLLKKEFKDLSRDNQTLIINLIDSNKDGYISYNDLILFLFYYLNYKSTKLAWILVEDYLNQLHITPEEFTIKFENEIIERDQFTNIFIKEFNLEKIIVIDMYEILFDKVIKKYQRNMIKEDIITQIKSQSKPIHLSKSASNSTYKHQTITITQNQKPILDSKHNTALKKSMMGILKGFLSIDNICEYFNLKDQISCYQFREEFIKKCNINYIEGIQLLLHIRDESSDHIFINDLKAYVKQLFSNELKKIKFSMTSLLNVIDPNGSYFILCLETFPYSPNVISSIELKNHIKAFYPSLPSQLIANIIKAIDKDKNGTITYKSITDFVFQFTKTQYSLLLILKAISCYLEQKQYNTATFMERFVLLNQSDILTLDETRELFITQLQFTELQHQFFIANHMTLGEFINNIKMIRVNEGVEKVYDDEKTEENIGIENIELLNIDYSDIDQYVYINPNLNISILEFLNYIKEKNKDNLSQSNKDKERKKKLKQLILFLKRNDTNQLGTISYKRLQKIIKWKNNARFHLQYISVWILLNFNGSIVDYLKYKNLTENKYLKRAEFNFYFEDEEMLNDPYISSDIFDYFETKLNLFDVKSFLDYIKFISKDISIDSIPESKWEEMVIKEIESIEFKTMKPFYLFFDILDIENIFGRVKVQTIKKAIAKTYKDIEVNEQVMVLFVNLFSTNKSNLLVDLIKAALFINSITKYKLTIDKIIKNLRRNRNKADDNALMSIDKNATLVDFYHLMHGQYKLTSYEVILLFYDAFNSSNNRYKNTFELDMDYCCSKYNLRVKLKKTQPQQPKQTKDEKDKDKSSASIITPGSNKNPLPSSSLNTNISHLDSINSNTSIEKRRARAMRVFNRLAFMIKVRSKDDLQSFFEKFDLNHNGHISRDELLNILNLFDSLNDNDKMLIINYADYNNLDDIQIQKFINIINSVKFDDDEYEALQKEISQSKSQFVSVVNYPELQTNYLINKRKLRNIAKDELAKAIYYLQEDLYNTFNKSDTFEKDFFELSNNDTTSNTISYEEFYEITKAVLEDYDIELTNEMNEELIKCAYEGEKLRPKKILTYTNFKVIPYPGFIKYVVNYQIKDAPKEVMESKNIASMSKIQAKLNKKFENRNNQFSEYFNKKFQKQIDLNKVEDVVDLKNVLLDTFCFSEQSIKGIQDKNIFLFKKFLTEISESNYSELPYELKEEDYFVRSDGKVITTILNSETSALKKCELLFNGLKDKEMFFDTDFGSLRGEDDIQDHSGRKSIYYNMAPNGQIDPKMIGWYRLNEISKNPQFLCKDPHSSEVVQGALGNCWFISALAAIATKDHLIRGEFNESILDDGIIDDEESLMLSSGVYPPLFHYFRKKNIFCFRFFKDLQWKYVIIDDRIPCIKRLNNNQNLKVIYGKCRNSNEFWVSLIEKAYAKLHGCYEAITSGCTDDGIMDLTGQVSKRGFINLYEDPTIVGNYIWDLFESYNVTLIKKESNRRRSYLEKQIQSIIVSKNNSVVVCEVEAKTNHQEIRIDQENSGLLVNHAYTVLNSLKITKQKGDKTKVSKIIRMKNPWGFKTWSGKWGINSEEFEKNKNLIQEELNKMDPNADILDQGTFFMCFSDFLKIFTKLYLGIQLYPSYIGFYYNESWSSALQTALPFVDQELFCSNPQYYFQVKNKTKVFIQLYQKDGRMEYSMDTCFPFASSLLRTCLVVVKTEGKQRINVLDKNNIVKISPIRLHRDNSIEGLFEPGEYIIIPCNCDTGKEGSFKLIFYVLDTFKVDSVDDNDFINQFNNTYVERLNHEKEMDNNIKPHLIKENTKQAILKTKEEKKNVLFYQLKKALTIS